MPETTPPAPTSAGARAAALVFVAFLVLQVAIPTVQLFAPRPARYGWQMFSGADRVPQFSILMADGSIRPVQLRDYLGNPRADLDLADTLPPHLCRVTTGAAAVLIDLPLEDRSERYRCR